VVGHNPKSRANFFLPPLIFSFPYAPNNLQVFNHLNLAALLKCCCLTIRILSNLPGNGISETLNLKISSGLCKAGERGGRQNTRGPEWSEGPGNRAGDLFSRQDCYSVGRTDIWVKYFCVKGKIFFWGVNFRILV
jgi:hypothetical protein